MSKGEKNTPALTIKRKVPLVTGDVKASLAATLKLVRVQNQAGNLLVRYSVNMGVPEATLTFELP